MRISTNNMFDQQTFAIDNLMFNQTQLGNQLSSGKSLNQPSDNPSQVSQDLQLHNLIGNTTTSATNVQGAGDELSQVDSTLGELTSSLQSVRALATRGASDVLTQTDKNGIVSQLNEILGQMVQVANSQYGGAYLFSGTSVTHTPPVQPFGTPIVSVNFTGNNQTQGELYADGESVSLSTTMQQAFNFNAADGSLNAFQTVINLRNALAGTGGAIVNGAGTTVNGSAIDQSSQSVNAVGQILDATTALGAQANAFATPLQFPAGQFQFNIDGPSGNQTFTITNADAIDGGATSIVGQINAASAATGVTATWDQRTQKLTLSSAGAFALTDVTGNFTAAFGLTLNSDTTDNVSRQLGDIDNVLNVALAARTQVGQAVDTLNTLKDRYNTSITNNEATQSQIEDTNFPTTISAFTESQTALQAAYTTTTRLEAHTLMDYL
jgi:flagellar hook-associated protein 3 FlgL